MNTPANNNTDKMNRKDVAICICCLTFFPALYLIGSTIKGLIG